MRAPDRGVVRRRGRIILAWGLTALLVGVAFALPDGDDSVGPPPEDVPGDAPNEPRKLDIREVSPPSANPGGAVTITHFGADDESVLKAFAGKREIEVLARGPGSMVVRLPQDTATGRLKLRISAGGERSKPYDLRVKPPNWRKPFRNLVGGLALLLFGISIFSRGVRGAAGFRSARQLARLAGRGPAAFGLGTIVGGLGQSTTAAAGFLAGLVASGLLAVAPAATAFLGAQIGASAVPLLTGLIDSREGLLVIAVGILWLGLASDRRVTAVGRLVLGAGLISFGLQTLRPGFDLFVNNPTLLSIVTRLNSGSVLDIAACALLGAVLVAALQGPAPVILLVLVLAQTTARWDLRTALAVLSGSGLGAAVGALLTTPAGHRCRQLAKLHVLLSLASTLIAASTINLWSTLADRLVPGLPHEVTWGKRVLLPNLGLHLGAAFALSQLTAAALLAPFVPRLARFLDRVQPPQRVDGMARVGDSVGVVRAELSHIVQAQHAGIEPLLGLALEGRREDGRLTEHRLADAHASIEDLLSGPVPGLPPSAQGNLLGRAAFASLQVQRALESLHRQAERLMDSRMAASSGTAGLAPLPAGDESIVREMHVLLAEGLASLQPALEGDGFVDLDVARAREIRMNGIEARARTVLLSGNRERATVRNDLGVLELVDAYETVGNQVYRLAEALSDSDARAEAMG